MPFFSVDEPTAHRLVLRSGYAWGPLVLGVLAPLAALFMVLTASWTELRLDRPSHAYSYSTRSLAFGEDRRVAGSLPQLVEARVDTGLTADAKGRPETFRFGTLVFERHSVNVSEAMAIAAKGFLAAPSTPSLLVTEAPWIELVEGGLMAAFTLPLAVFGLRRREISLDRDRATARQTITHLGRRTETTQPLSELLGHAVTARPHALSFDWRDGTRFHMPLPLFFGRGPAEVLGRVDRFIAPDAPASTLPPGMAGKTLLNALSPATVLVAVGLVVGATWLILAANASLPDDADKLPGIQRHRAGTP